MRVEDLFFRSWNYLRIGWMVYFYIIFAFVNFITLVYAFIISDFQFLKTIFPGYMEFAGIVAIVIFGLCTIFGIKHFRSGARRSEIDINFETEPYFRRRTVNSEMVLKTYLIISKLLIKSNSEKNQEHEDIDLLKNEIDEMKEILENRTMSNKLDINYIKTETQEKS